MFFLVSFYFICMKNVFLIIFYFMSLRMSFFIVFILRPWLMSFLSDIQLFVLHGGADKAVINDIDVYVVIDELIHLFAFFC